MTRKTSSQGKPITASSGKDLKYNRELAIGTILIMVVLALLIGICIVSTMPQSPSAMSSIGVMRGSSSQQNTGTSNTMTLQQAIKKAL